MLFVVSYFLISLTRSTFNETYDLVIDKEQLVLIRPILGTTKIIDIKTVRGFSTSEIKYGSRWGKSLFEGKSIVLYTHDHSPIEFIQYNYRQFETIEEKFREMGLTYFGYEKYQTGLLSRKYEF
jgi:hypothetical protein